MFEQFQQIDLFPISTENILLSLIVSFVCGVIISIVYRITYNGPNYSRTFVNSLIVLTIITSLVLLVIGNNLARAFGLVGAMSIIRFRTAVRDVQDIIYIFFALSIGMASGVGLYPVAIVGTVFISIVLILVSNTNVFKTSELSYLLHIVYDPNKDKISLKQILDKSSKSNKIINIRALDDKKVETYFNLKLNKDINREELVSKIKNLESTEEVNIYFDEDDVNINTNY